MDEFYLKNKCARGHPKWVETPEAVSHINPTWFAHISKIAPRVYITVHLKQSISNWDVNRWELEMENQVEWNDFSNWTNSFCALNTMQ